MEDLDKTKKNNFNKTQKFNDYIHTIKDSLTDKFVEDELIFESQDFKSKSNLKPIKKISSKGKFRLDTTSIESKICKHYKLKNYITSFLVSLLIEYRSARQIIDWFNCYRS